MADIQKLNKTFTREEVLQSDEMNAITEKIDEIIDVTNLVPALEEEVFPLTIQVSGGGIFEKGLPKNITVQWNVKKGGQTITADTVTVNDEPVSGDSKDFFDVNTTTVYTVKAVKAGKQVQGSTTATFIAPMYLGFAPAEAVADLDITSLEKQPVKTTPSGAYTLNNDITGNYLWLCVPNSMTIRSVTSSGFAVPMEQAQTQVTELDIYKCYRSSSRINEGEINIVIS